MDRLHRMGQLKNVHVFSLISKSSIEEKMLELKFQKKELMDELPSTQADFLKQFDLTDLFQDEKDEK